MAEWGKERKTGLGVTLGEMSVPTLFSPCLTVNDRQEHPSPWIQGTHWHYYTIQSLRVMNIYDSTVLHKCVSTQFLQTWDNNNTFYFKVRRHLESISFWRKKKKKGGRKISRRRQFQECCWPYDPKARLSGNLRKPSRDDPPHWDSGESGCEGLAQGSWPFLPLPWGRADPAGKGHTQR